MGRKEIQILEDIKNQLESNTKKIDLLNEECPKITLSLQQLIPISDVKQNTEYLKQEVEEFKNRIKQEIIEDLPKTIRKGNHLVNVNFEKNTSATEELNNSITETKKFMEETLDCSLKEATKQFKELMDYRNKIKNLEEERESWRNTAVEFFQYIERTLEILRESDDEDAQANQESISIKHDTYEKVLKDFEKYVDLLGLQKICPKSDEDVNEKLHKVEQKESKDVQPGKIIRCKKWGYTINGQRYGDKYAEVIVAKSPEPNKNANQGSESEPENSEPSGNVKDDAQALVQNYETLNDNDATPLDSVGEENGQPDTSLNQPEIPQTPENDSPSDSDLDKSGEDGKNNLQDSSAVDTSTSQ